MLEKRERRKAKSENVNKLKCHCEEQRRFLRYARNRLRNIIK